MRLNRIGVILALIISSTFAGAYTNISLKQYYAHQSRGDLTAYAQGMWNTLNGNFMASTYNYSVHNYYDKVSREINADNSNIFGIHFNPILLFLLPFYALSPLPETLLVIQALLVAAGGFFMYLLARKIQIDVLVALLFEGAYLLYFATVSAVLSQFHAYTLSLLFGPVLLLTSRIRSNLLFGIALALFLMVQENSALIAFFFGLYLMVNRDSRFRGLFTAIISAMYFFVVIQVIIPAFSPYHFYLFSGIYGSPLGGNIPSIIKTTITNPLLFLQTLFTTANISYLGKLLLGIFPFALFAPTTVAIGFSALAQNLLSSSAGLKTQEMHYESGSVAILFYAAMLGYSWISTKKIFSNQLSRTTLIILLILITGISYKRYTSYRLNPSLLRISLFRNIDAKMDQLLAQVPDQASISTQDYLSAQLSSRKQLYQFPVYADQAEYVLLTKTDQVWPLTIDSHQAYLTKLRSSHSIVAENDSFVLFHRQ